MGFFDTLKKLIFGEKKPAKVTPKTPEKYSYNPVKQPSFESKPRASSASTAMGDSWAYEVDGLEEIKKHKDRFVAIDLETTGLSVETGDRIIEIGAVIFENGKKVKEFNTLVDPNRPIPSAASRVNHIYDHDVIGAPKTKEALSMFLDFLGDVANREAMVVAHNAPFDLKFLMTAFNYCGYNVKVNYIDTLKYSRKFVKNLSNYKLGTVARHFKISNKKAHRATSDAEVCGQIFINLMKIADLAVEEHHASFRKSDNAISEREMEVCAYIQKVIQESGGDLKFLRFYKSSAGSIHVLHPYKFMIFKIGKKNDGYIVIPKEYTTGISMLIKPCAKSEGGEEAVRCYFNTLSDLDPLKEYIKSAWRRSNVDLENAWKLTGLTDERIENDVLKHTVPLPVDKMNEILKNAYIREAEDKKKREAKQSVSIPDNKEEDFESLAAPIKETIPRPDIVQLDDEENEVNVFPSVAEASRVVGVNAKSIREVLKGNQHHAGGFKWKYKE